MKRDPASALPPPGRAVWVFAVLAWTSLGLLAFAQNVAFLEYRGIPYEWGRMLATTLAD